MSLETIRAIAHSIEPSNPKVVDVMIEQQTSKAAVVLEDRDTHAGNHVPVTEFPGMLSDCPVIVVPCNLT